MTINEPTLPLTVPGGVNLAVTGASLAIDEATGTLTLTGNVQADNGIGGSLAVTIAHSANTELGGAASADLSATVGITGVPVLDSTVDLSGTLSYTNGSVSASITGTLTNDLTVVPDVLTIAKDSTVTLSTADGLTLSGSAVIGDGSSSVTVDVTGKVKGAKDFSLTVDDTTNPPSFTPTSGLTLDPRAHRHHQR